MRNIRALFKFIIFCLALTSYFISASILHLFSKNKEKSLQFLVSFYCKIALKIFSIKVTHNILNKKIAGSLIVSNHLSYLDIIAISSVVPTNFITSTEIERTPVLGHICRLASCIFVDRRGRMNRQNELEKISSRLERGENIVIFPEATSTNGEQLIPFKKGLFESVIGRDFSISNICVQYTTLDEKPLNFKNRDKVCWYGYMAFLPHLWEMLKLKSIQMSLTLVSTENSFQYNDVTPLVSKCYEDIKNEFNFVSSVNH